MPIMFIACLNSYVDFVLDAAHLVRDSIAVRLSSCGLSDEALEQVLAFTLGIRDNHSEIASLYRQAGVSHVLALSGLHLGIFCTLFLPAIYMVRQVWGPMWQRMLAVSAVLFLTWFYVLIAGAPMSMVRAATMFSIALVSALSYWRWNMLQVWLVSVMLILIVSPRSLMDIGFQLSSVAVMGIATFGVRGNNGGGNVCWQWLRIGFWCQVFTMPLVAHYFGTFVPHAFLTSLFVTTYTTAVIYMCFLLLLSLFIFPSAVSFFLAQSINGLLWIQTGFLRVMTNLCPPFSGIAFSWWCVALYYICLALLFFVTNETRGQGETDGVG